MALTELQGLGWHHGRAREAPGQTFRMQGTWVVGWGLGWWW